MAEKATASKAQAEEELAAATAPTRFKAKQRMINIAPNGTDQTVVEEGQVVEAEHPFVALHPAQFEAV